MHITFRLRKGGTLPFRHHNNRSILIIDYYLELEWAPVAFCVSLFGSYMFVNIGVNPLWTIIPEFFPYRFRSTGKSFAGNTSEIYIIAATFVAGYSVLGFGSHIAFAVWFLVVFLYLFAKCPETKNKMPAEAFPEFLELGD